jgi:hypothetical protein
MGLTSILIILLIILLIVLLANRLGVSNSNVP